MTNEQLQSYLEGLQKAVIANDLCLFRQYFDNSPSRFNRVSEKQAQAVQTSEAMQNLEDFIFTLSLALQKAKVLRDGLKGQTTYETDLEALKNNPLMSAFLYCGARSLPSEPKVTTEKTNLGSYSELRIEINNTHPRCESANDAECHERFINSAYNLLKTVFPIWPRPMLPAERICPKEALYYAEFVACGRVPEIEPLMLRDGEHAGCYAYWSLKKRWPEAERIALQNPAYAKDYQVFVDGFPPCPEVSTSQEGANIVPSVLALDFSDQFEALGNKIPTPEHRKFPKPL